ncbi:uncharacterized, partial [Tachysurus ichikawai]
SKTYFPAALPQLSETCAQQWRRTLTSCSATVRHWDSIAACLLDNRLDFSSSYVLQSHSLCKGRIWQGRQFPSRPPVDADNQNQQRTCVRLLECRPCGAILNPRTRSVEKAINPL